MSLRPALLVSALVLASAAIVSPGVVDAAQKKASASSAPAPGADSAALAKAVAGDWRDPKNVARDRYRHPVETLTFFGVKPTDTVVEITPAPGWYTEILAPYLRERGHYIAAVVDPMSAPEGKSRDGQQKSKTALEAKLSATPAHYAGAKVVGYDPKAPTFGAPGSADVVLTFRNVHNWRMNGNAEGMFKGFFAVLRKGGTLGVVEHRAKADVSDKDESGYVGQAQVIAMATAAGFKLAGQSEVNANPKDTKDYRGGVWTLPPSNDHPAADDAKFAAIGESDRMTLRFVKP